MILERKKKRIAVFSLKSVHCPAVHLGSLPEKYQILKKAAIAVPKKLSQRTDDGEDDSCQAGVGGGNRSSSSALSSLLWW